MQELHLLASHDGTFMPSAFLLEKTHLLYSEKESILHILPRVPMDFEEAGVDGLCRVASVEQMFIEETAFLEPGSRAARVR